VSRIHTDEQLKDCSKLELEKKLNMVNTSIDLSLDETRQNRDMINFYLNGGVRGRREDVVKDIKAGQADTDDIGGH